jgi:CRISPR system Cascade subunit CasA
MPRRIRLDFNSREDGACGVCAREGPVIKQFFTRPQGVRYAGAWRHPLTPYREDRNGTPVALHPNPSGLGYRQWAALAFGSKADGIMPAATVTGARRRGVGTVAKAVLWAYGYDMDRMKARCWYETRMPVYQLDEAVVEVVRSDVSYMVSASQEVANNLRSCVKRAWFRHVDDAKKRADLAAVTRAFWDRTEPPFFDIVDRVVEARRGSGDATPLLWEWFDVLHRSSLELFETWCHGDETAEPARVALAEIDLRRFNHKKSIKEALHLDARRLAGREKP